jgi:hypothetical protein
MKKDMHRFVKWPKYVRIQRQRRVLNQRLKVRLLRATAAAVGPWWCLLLWIMLLQLVGWGLAG